MPRRSDESWWHEARSIAERQARGGRQPSDAADDLAQDLAVAALEQGARIERPGAWLERAGRNARIDRWRLERRREELATELEPPSPAPDPEARLLDRERRGVLRRAIAALPRPLRRAALARFHAELPFEDVAERLGTRPVTARTRVHRALARLRDGLGGLRVILLPLKGAQATMLGLTLLGGVARPALLSASATPTPMALASENEAPRFRRYAQARVTAPARPAPVVHAPAPTPASAQHSVQPAAPPAVQRMSFDEDVVEVGVLRPDGPLVLGDAKTKQPSLIELRRHFMPELVKTLEDL